MFDSKTVSIYRISCLFAKWAGTFCKMLSDDDIDLRDKLFELSQSVPLNIAASGRSHATITERQNYFKDALHCVLQFSSLFNTLHNSSFTNRELIDDGQKIVAGIIALLTEELSMVVLTKEMMANTSSTLDASNTLNTPNTTNSMAGILR
jgi:hypothetical protein